MSASSDPVRGSTVHTGSRDKPKGTVHVKMEFNQDVVSCASHARVVLTRSAEAVTCFEIPTATKASFECVLFRDHAVRVFAMKFGRFFEFSVNQPWKNHYLRYSELKNYLKVLADALHARLKPSRSVVVSSCPQHRRTGEYLSSKQRKRRKKQQLSTGGISVRPAVPHFTNMPRSDSPMLPIDWFSARRKRQFA